MECGVIVFDGVVEKVARGRVEVFRIEAFIAQRVFRGVFIGPVAEYGGYGQPPFAFRKLPLELRIVFHGHGNGAYGKKGIEPGDALPLEGIKAVSFGLPVEVIENIADDFPHALRGIEHLFGIDGPHLFILNIIGHFYGVHIVDAERKHVSVVDGVHNGVGVELVAEGLRRGPHAEIAAASGIFCKDGRTGKAENMIFFEGMDYFQVHVAELGAVALVENDDDVLFIRLVPGIAADEHVQLLDGGNDDARVGIFELLLQHAGGGVAVGGPLLELFIFLHGLVIQILAVDHEKHLVDAGHPAGQLCGLEGGQRFSAARGVPDIAPGSERALLMVVAGNLYAGKDAFRRGDLVRAHDEKKLFRREHAKTRENVEQRML